MGETLRRGDLVVILAIAEVRGDDGEGGATVSKDGFEDGLLHVLDQDTTIRGGSVFARVLLLGEAERPPHGSFDALREVGLDAADLARALLRGDPRLAALVEPWLRENAPWRMRENRSE